MLHEPYTAQKARLVLLEMAEAMSLKLVRKRLVTDQLVLTIGYDTCNLKTPAQQAAYHGEGHIDRYGRAVPKHAHGTHNFQRPTASSRAIMQAAAALFDRLDDPALYVRRLTIEVGHVISEETARDRERQQTLFDTTPPAVEEALRKERALQETVLALKDRFGKNTILRATSLEEGATAIARNAQIGGHRA